MRKSNFRALTLLSLLVITQVFCSCSINTNVTAKVYEDADGNGSKNGSEIWLPGITLTWGSSKVTDENGTVVFAPRNFTTESACRGASSVSIQVPEGYRITQQGTYLFLQCRTKRTSGFYYFDVPANQSRETIFGLAPITPPETQPEIIPAPTEETNFGNPALSLTKNVDHTSCIRADEQFNYTYTITNIGDVALAGPFTLSDNKIPSLNCEQDLSTLVLQPNESVTCTGIYFSTDVESEIGAVIRNEAVASVVYMQQTVTSNTAIQEVFCIANPNEEEEEPTEDPCAGGPPYPETCTNPPTPEG
jgi:hypothetical protein